MGQGLPMFYIIKIQEILRKIKMHALLQIHYLYYKSFIKHTTIRLKRINFIDGFTFPHLENHTSEKDFTTPWRCGWYLNK